MYPCSNPELVAAASNGGGMSILQPVSLTFVHGYELREGIKYIRSMTDKPIGFNALIEKGSKNSLLIPRFPERMPVKVFDHSKVGKCAKICEDGYLAFIFWLDIGLDFEENISGLAYTEEGIMPIFRDL